MQLPEVQRARKVWSYFDSSLPCLILELPIARLFIRPRDSGLSTVSLPAFATMTAMYGTTTAPTNVNQRQGLGRNTVAMKQAVRNIME